MSDLFPLEKEPAIHFNRTRVEIFASILGVASKGALKTHIMYKANLSHRQLERYLGFLTGNGMIAKVTDEIHHGSLYEITEKGIEFLKDYSRLSADLVK
jgi:predicted transcriptional regulator